MPAGITYKQCGCRGENGKRLGQHCPKLRRGNGSWSPSHGRWYYQIELPPSAEGLRRPPLRRGGFGSQAEAGKELNQARELLAIATPGDIETAIRIADAITKATRETRKLPEPARVRKAVGGGHDPAVRPPTTGEWLEEWLAAKKNLRAGTVRSYASHIRLYYQPHIGSITIDRLRVTDVASVFEAIDELNDVITRPVPAATPDYAPPFTAAVSSAQLPSSAFGPLCVRRSAAI